MLREFRVNGADAPAATFVAHAELKTGMGVTKAYATGKTAFPSAATGEKIFLVQKVREATGAYAGMDLSDYYDEYNTVKQDDRVVLYSYRADSVFGTDQYDTTNITASSTFPVYVVVGTNGKWTPATSTTTSAYMATGLYDDAGHTLLRVEVVDTPTANS